ncbi:hypothetical protein BDY19DRAFT_185683 [Irpex rosettiformis]|uniref:Uncharacterized protein n=1 Tax=Irpex rosettiformis TaxID=378272 RepID=A0ACB8U1R3_9APHY|nr:hypothetical protein BDY19DRAFT_185683 [Irpex rosettiformis]
MALTVGGRRGVCVTMKRCDCWVLHGQCCVTPPPSKDLPAAKESKRRRRPALTSVDSISIARLDGSSRGHSAAEDSNRSKDLRAASPQQLLFPLKFEYFPPLPGLVPRTTTHPNISCTSPPLAVAYRRPIHSRPLSFLTPSASLLSPALRTPADNQNISVRPPRLIKNPFPGVSLLSRNSRHFRRPERPRWSTNAHFTIGDFTLGILT